jgi:peptide chain release factor
MWLQISSGRGPREVQRAVYLYANELMEQFKQNHYDAFLLDMPEGAEKKTALSALIRIEEKALAFVADFTGVILWQCTSPYRPKHKRKNWFFSAELYREIPDETFCLQEIQIETMRSGGKGGQHVNKTESAVRVKHLPSGLSAIAREERSQLQNRKLALARLYALFTQNKLVKQNVVLQNIWQQHNTLTRGNAKRVYKGLDFKEIL